MGQSPQVSPWPSMSTPQDPHVMPSPVRVAVAHGVMARVLLVLLTHLEAHLLDTPVVGPVHLGVFVGQRGG